MIEPIVLTEYGETLRGYPDSQTGDEGKLSTCIGVHDVCNCWVDIKQVSSTHHAILCRGCALRVVVPKNSVTTFGDLREFFKQYQPALAGAT